MALKSKLQMFWTSLDRKGNLVIIIAGIILASYIAFLLGMNYLSQIRLRESTLEQLKQDTEKRAMATSYFFSERKNDLEDLAMNRMISAFFENKALGMSMEYGLRSNLLTISKMLKHFLTKKNIVNTQIYKRIAFIDNNGNKLADTQKIDSDQPYYSWQNFLTPEQIDVSIFIIHNEGFHHIIASIPYFFKKQYAGQIIAWISPQTVFTHLIKIDNKFSDFRSFVDLNSGHYYPQINIYYDLSPSDLNKMKSNNTHSLQTINRSGDTSDMLAIRMPIDGTPFHILTLAPLSKATGYTNPKQMLSGMIVIALFILGGTSFILKTNTENLVLSTRLDEESKRKREIEEKNSLLKTEIIERKKIETALRKSEEGYRTLFENSKDAICIITQNGNFNDANNAMSNLLGYTKEELLGMNVLVIVDANDHSTFIREVENQGATKDYELNLVKKDGTQLDCLVTSTLHRDTSSDIIVFQNIVRNVTESKKAAKKMEEAKKVAESANRTKSEFLANMSHELRTPLNHIIGFTQLTVDKQFGNLNEIQEGYLNDVLDSSNHLLSLINDILDLSKVEAGKHEIEPSDVYLEMIMENSIIMVKEKTLNHGINLQVNMDQHSPETIYADERMLKQIMYNLLSNAVKFTPDGGTVSITTTYLSRQNDQWINPEGQKVFLPIAEDESIICHDTIVKISIEDSGIGIKQVNFERIFEPFEQGDGSATRHYQGTGLGLSLTRKLVELHGGRIWAESEGEGKGSTFSFVIPI